MRRLPLLLLLCTLPVAAGCGGKNSDPATAQTGNAGSGANGGRGGRGGQGGPVPVTVATVASTSIPVTIPAVGTAEALQTVQIRSQVAGQLSAVHFSEGQEVKKGDLLFTLDPRPFQAALAQAQAVLARDTATATNAGAEQKRYEDLYQRGLLPRDQYEAQLAASQAAQATLEADQAAIQTAQLNLQFSKISAPIGGRTGSLQVHTGDLIRANDTTPMVIINQLSPIYVTFAVPGRYLTDIRRFQAQKPLAVHAVGQSAAPPGAQTTAPPNASQSLVPGVAPAPSLAPMQPIEPSSPAAGGSPIGAPATREDGAITFIDNAVDPTTGTIKLKGTFQNAGHALWPGLFVQVTLDLTTQKNVLVVPAPAVQTSQAGQFVYVVKPDKSVDVRSVVVERQQGDQMVIAQGLSAGEEVVTEGQLRLTPGAKVTTAPPLSSPGRTRGNGS